MRSYERVEVVNPWNVLYNISEVVGFPEKSEKGEILYKIAGRYRDSKGLHEVALGFYKEAERAEWLTDLMEYIERIATAQLEDLKSRYEN